MRLHFWSSFQQHFHYQGLFWKCPAEIFWVPGDGLCDPSDQTPWFGVRLEELRFLPSYGLLLMSLGSPARVFCPVRL